MQIDHTIRALRGSEASQRHANRALEKARAGWDAGAEGAAILADLDRYAAGCPIRDCDALSSLFAGSGPDAIIPDLMARYLTVLATEPLGQIPLRHAANGKLTSLLLAASGRVQLSLVAYEPQSNRLETATFTGGERHECVLAGSARAVLATLATATGEPMTCQELTLKPGVTLAYDGSRQALLIRHAPARTVSLRLVRPLAADAQPTREYRLADGALVRQSAGDPVASRREMMASLLTALAPDKAAPLLAEQARRGPDHQRWQALRECLSVDTARGFAVLGAIAADTQDSLAAPAAQLKAQLLRQHPALAQLEVEPCPA